MSFTEAVRSCLQKYVTFSGRARRSEYWWFTLASLLFVFVVIGVLWLVVGLIAYLTDNGIEPFTGVLVGLSSLAYLVLILPSLAVFVRRLHDTGRTGWWWWLGFIPFGGLVLLVFTCLDSQPGDNKYGPSPKPLAGSGAGPTWQ